MFSNRISSSNRSQLPKQSALQDPMISAALRRKPMTQIFLLNAPICVFYIANHNIFQSFNSISSFNCQNKKMYYLHLHSNINVFFSHESFYLTFFITCEKNAKKKNVYFFCKNRATFTKLGLMNFSICINNIQA